MNSCLKIEGLKKYFGSKQVLDGLSLEVPASAVTTIIGKSGIGKSVLLKCIAGLIEPDAGMVELDGRPVGGARKGGYFSYMFQNNALFDSLTAFENIALPLRETMTLRRLKCGTGFKMCSNRLSWQTRRLAFQGSCLAG